MQHTMADGAGLAQLLGAVAELARGATTPTVRPVWARELLEASLHPPSHRSSSTHREYDHVPANTTDSTTTVPLDAMAHRSFFFGPREVAALRSHLPQSLRNRATTFEALTGCLWKCRAAALSVGPDEVMRMICIVNIRGRRGRGSIPRGYYGNAFAFPVAMASAGDLCKGPLGYAVELVMKAKREVDMEYLQSVARLMVRRGRPNFAVVNAYLVSDVSKSGFRDIDFGWGKPVYAGPAKGGVGVGPGVASFLIALRNSKGEDGIVVPVCLPAPEMDKFEEEMSKMLQPAVDTPRLAMNMIKALL